MSETPQPQPIETAPKVAGKRILAYCEAAESSNAWNELYWTGKKWWWVTDHPFANACPYPTWWLPAPVAPGK